MTDGSPTGQLALLAVDPTLPPRQAAVLDAVRRAGRDGLDASEAGALIRPDSARDGRFDAVNGKGVLEALRKKGLVSYRRATRSRPGGWVEANPQVEVEGSPAGMLPDTESLPF